MLKWLLGLSIITAIAVFGGYSTATHSTPPSSTPVFGPLKLPSHRFAIQGEAAHSFEKLLSDYSCLDGSKLTLSERAHLARLLGRDHENSNRVAQLLLSRPSDFEYTPDGRIRYRLDLESHPGQALCALAECGISLSDAFETKQGTRSVCDLVDNAAHSINFDDDLEWRTVALAIYRPTSSPWDTDAGKPTSFSLIAKELLRRARGRGLQDAWCWGTHRLYALAVLRSVHKAVPIWQDAQISRQVDEVLTRASEQLSASQRIDGSWDEHWSLSAPLQSPMPLTQKLLITGHHLEWLSLVEPALQPNALLIERSTQFVLATSAHMQRDDQINHICPISHGLRSVLTPSSGID